MVFSEVQAEASARGAGAGSASSSPDFIKATALHAIDAETTLREYGAPPMLLRLIVWAFHPLRSASSVEAFYVLRNGDRVAMTEGESVPILAVDVAFVGVDRWVEPAWADFPADAVLSKFLGWYYPAGSGRARELFLKRAIIDFAGFMIARRGLG